MNRTVRTFLLLGFSCLWLSASASAQTQAPPKLTREQRQELRKEWEALDAQAARHYQSRRFEDMLTTALKALEVAEALYPKEDYPNGHPTLARSLNTVGFVLATRREYRRALGYHERALAISEWLHGKEDHPDLATELNNVGFVLHSLGEYRRALGYHERALAMRERLYGKKDRPDVANNADDVGWVLHLLGEPLKAMPYFERALAMRERLYGKRDHPTRALSLHHMGAALQSLGEYRRALGYHERALAMRERLLGKQDHPDLATGLTDMGFVLQSLGEYRQALGYYERALAMEERLYDKEDHLIRARTLNCMGFVLQLLGEPAKALGYHERALAMYVRLFDKKDRPDLAISLNDMGFALRALGQAGKALPYFERALAMTKRLYAGKDHPLLATYLNNMGNALESVGEHRKALVYYQDALAMNQRLYGKKDHPHLATGLNDMGFALQTLGDARKALLCYQRALDMQERLYANKDHPLLARTLNNMGFALQLLGETNKSLPYYERALAMQRKLINDLALSSAEANILSFTSFFPLTLDDFLMVCLAVEGSDGRAYSQVWQGKLHLTRILQARHLAVRASKDEAALALWEQLRQTRRDLARLLNTPGLNRDEREKQLRQLNEAKETRERQLVALLPEYQRLTRTDQQGVDDLLKALPANAVFIDLLRYHKFDKKSIKLHYIAFVLRKGKPAVRIELGAAKDIDETLAAWLKAINTWSVALPARDAQDLLAETDRLGQKLSKRVWTPLAPHIPAHAVLYLSPDGDLSRLPWAALPIDGESVLVQKHLLCQVPHGPFLLERLTTKKKADERKGSVLAVGGVDYGTPLKKPGAPHYPELPGTKTELKQVLTLAGQRDRTSLSGKEASTARVLAELLRANYVHLATHGEFKEALLSEERQRIQEQLQHWQGPSALGTDRLGLGIRNPLSYVGVALAQANEPAQAGPDGGILSAETIVEQPLEKVRLTVLSACETGLGAYTQAEGVQGLVRAFHVAGCPNVVASLWKVNDEATAALMARFYRELWDEGKSPAEALRAAQLLLYTHPEVVGSLARGVRGAPDFDRAVKVDPGKDAASKGKRLPPKLWAAFVISGIGQ